MSKIKFLHIFHFNLTYYLIKGIVFQFFQYFEDHYVFSKFNSNVNNAFKNNINTKRFFLLSCWYYRWVCLFNRLWSWANLLQSKIWGKNFQIKLFFIINYSLVNKLEYISALNYTYGSCSNRCISGLTNIDCYFSGKDVDNSASYCIVGDLFSGNGATPVR